MTKDPKNRDFAPKALVSQNKFSGLFKKSSSASRFQTQAAALKVVPGLQNFTRGLVFDLSNFVLGNMLEDDEEIKETPRDIAEEISYKIEHINDQMSSIEKFNQIKLKLIQQALNSEHNYNKKNNLAKLADLEY